MPRADEKQSVFSRMRERVSDDFTDARRFAKKHNIFSKSGREKAREKEVQRHEQLLSGYGDYKDMLAIKQKQAQGGGGEASQDTDIITMVTRGQKLLKLLGGGVDLLDKLFHNEIFGRALEIAGAGASFGGDIAGLPTGILSSIKTLIELKESWEEVFSPDTKFESNERMKQKVERALATTADLIIGIVGMIPGCDIVSSIGEMGSAALHVRADTHQIREDEKDAKSSRAAIGKVRSRSAKMALKYSAARAESDKIEATGARIEHVTTAVAAGGAAIADGAGATVGAADAGKVVKAIGTGLNAGTGAITKRVKAKHDHASDLALVNEDIDYAMRQKKMKGPRDYNDIRSHGAEEAVSFGERKRFTRRERNAALSQTLSGHKGDVSTVANVRRAQYTMDLLDPDSPNIKENIDALAAMGFVKIKKIAAEIDKKNASLPEGSKIPESEKLPSDYGTAKKLGFSGSEEEFIQMMMGTIAPEDPFEDIDVVDVDTNAHSPSPVVQEDLSGSESASSSGGSSSSSHHAHRSGGHHRHHSPAEQQTSHSQHEHKKKRGSGKVTPV